MSSKVLLLDDDAASAEQLEAALRELGFVTSLVPENDVFGAGRALARLAVERISLILISIAPPHLAGLATFERMRRDPRASKLPMVLVSTAFGMLHDHARSALPADGYIQRPHDPTVLLPELRRCFELLTDRLTTRDEPVAKVESPRTLGPLDDVPVPDDVADTEPPGALEEGEPGEEEPDVDEAPPSGLLPQRESRLMSHVPQSRGNLDELRERLREGRQVLAQLQERLHNEREEHAMAVARADFALSSANAANATIAKQALVSEQKAQDLEGQVGQLRGQVERLETQLESTIEQLAATAKQQRELEERRAREVQEVAARAETAQNNAVLSAVEEAMRRLREEHAEALATQAREHAVALERVTATLEKERRERAEEASWLAEDSPALAPLQAELESVRVALRDAEVAHAAALAAVEESRARERAAASQRHDELEKGTSEAVLLGIQQARRVVQEEHDETLLAMTRAHDSDLARERARADAAKAALESELQTVRSDLQGRLDSAGEAFRALTERLARADESLATLEAERDRVTRELAAARAEREAATWAAAVEAEQKVAEERAGERAALEKAEAALSALRAAHAEELVQLDRSVDKMLEQERQAAERSVAETRAAAVQAVAIGVREAQRTSRKEFETQTEERARAHALELSEVRAKEESARRELADDRDRLLARSKALEDELESERVARAAERGSALAEVEAERKARGEERQRLAAELETEREARAAASSVATGLADELARAKAAHAVLEATSAARLKELAEARDEQVARVRALEADVALGRTARAEAERRLAEADAKRVSEGATAAALADELRVQVMAGEDARRAEQARATAALASAESAAAVRQQELVEQREREAARVRALDDQLVAARAAHEELKQRLADADAKRAADAALAATQLAELQARVQVAEDAVRAEQARGAAALASTMAELAAQQSALTEMQTERDARAAEHRRAASDLEAERAAHLVTTSAAAHHQAELAQAQAARALADAESTARYQALVEERDAQVSRVRALEETVAGDRAARADLERGVLDAEAKRLADVGAAVATAEGLRSRLSAAEDALKAERARATSSLASAMADFAAQQATLFEDHERATARVASLEAELQRERDAHAIALREEDARHREREAALAAAAEQTGRESSSAAETRDALRAAEQAVADEKARAEALAVALRIAREGEQDLADGQRKLHREFEAERKAHEAALARASREAQTAAREATRTLAVEKARADDLAKELERERTSRDEQIARALAESTSYRERYEAAMAGASHEARESLIRAEERLRDQSAQGAAAAARLEAELAARDRQLESMRAEAERRVATLGDEHARAIDRLLVTETDERARQTAAHELALDELRCELNDRHHAEVERTTEELARVKAEQQALVAALRAELIAANEALAAERQSRAPLSARPRTQPDRVRPSVEYRHIAAEVSRTELIPSARPLAVRPSGELSIPRDPRDPREIVRTVLLRSLAAGQAELAITMALGAAGRKELPAERDELLALIERHLFAELIGHLGKKEANALMDELASAINSGTTARPPPVAELRASATKPPEMKSHVPTLRPSLPPDSDLGRPPASSRRAVLVIDGDRAGRTRVARDLAQAGCEVTVRDSCSNVAAGIHAFDVVVTDILGVSVDELLSSFGHRSPPCPIIAWTEDVETARALFGAAGLRGVRIVRKDARSEHLVATVRSTFGEAQGVARG